MDLLTVEDYARAARSVLPEFAWEFLDGGSGHEVTLRENRASFDRIQLNPRVLVDVSRIDTSAALFGLQLPFPILLAPAGYHKLFHPAGELASVQGANESDAHLMAACFATTPYADMFAAAGRPLSFQVYFQQNRDHTQRIVESVQNLGCAFFCVTVDVPLNGPRDRELHAGFQLPPGVERANLDFMGEFLAHGAHRPVGRDIYAGTRSAAASWSDLEWLRLIVKTPLLIKGVLNAEDAQRAVDSGVDGVIVSNHGGRSVDTTPATISVLPGIVERVGARVPVLLDGGVRRGIDVFKALALGARAVLIGRPYLYGLAAEGSTGVARVVEIVRTELEMTMGLCGCASLAEITRDRLLINT